MRFQGVANVMRFNWHFYLLAFLVVATVLSIAVVASSPALFVAGFLLAVPALGSIVVSYLVYDASKLYKFDWLDRLRIVNTSSVLNIHAGFDETTKPLTERFPNWSLFVFDFYDETKHTEISIRRARSSTASIPSAKVASNDLPLAENSIDLCLLIFAAHEIRSEPERCTLFVELRRSIKSSGRIVVTEHLRDIPNALAYNIGAHHFFSRSTWLNTFARADLSLIGEFKITPFVTAFVLAKNGTAT